MDSLRVNSGIKTVEVNDAGECISIPISDTAFFKCFGDMINNFERKKVEIEQQGNLSKDLDKAKASLDRLYDRRDSYTELGKKTPPKLELDISDAERKIRILEADIKELITTDKAYLPVDTSKVEQEITAAGQKQMQMY